MKLSKKARDELDIARGALASKTTMGRGPVKMIVPSGIFLNDTENDCSIAAVAHAVQVMFGAMPTDSDAQAAFTAWCPPTGCNDVVVLNHFRADGMSGRKIGWFRLTGSDAEHKAALALSGCSYVPMKAILGVADHCVLGLALDDMAFTCFSWGQVYKIPVADFRAGLLGAYLITDKGAWSPAMLRWRLRWEPKAWVWVAAAAAFAAAAVAALVLP